jgi:hypothetical protein
MSIKVHGSHFESSEKHIDTRSDSKQYAANTIQLSAIVKQIQHSWYLALCDRQHSLELPLWFDDEEFCQKQSMEQETTRVSDLQNLISENQSVIVYLRSLERYSGLLVNKTRLQHFDVGHIDDIDESIVGYIDMLSQPKHLFTQNVHTISKKLLPPEVTNHVKSTLTIAGLGKLCELPYFSLIKTTGNTKTPSTNLQNNATIDAKGFLCVDHFESICNKECMLTLNNYKTKQVLSTIIEDGSKIRLKSIWDIPEDVAQNFIQSFYHAMSESNRAQSAFQTAIERMTKKYGEEKPYYWAGFTMFKV